MEYIIIQPSAERTSSQRAWYISSLLWDIVKHPESVGTTYLFGVVEHPSNGMAALVCNTAEVMPLQNAAPLALLVDELGDTVGVEEAAQWAQSMIGVTVTFADLLPPSVVPKLEEEMEGWFETQS